MKKVTAVATLAVVASLLIGKGSAQTTVIGQFVANNLVWSDGQQDPCLQSNATTDQVCIPVKRSSVLVLCFGPAARQWSACAAIVLDLTSVLLWYFGCTRRICCLRRVAELSSRRVCTDASMLTARQVCTKLDRGGPNNATYVTAFTILDREHVIQVGIEDIGTQLTGNLAT